jgi:hypothetical protein
MTGSPLKWQGKNQRSLAVFAAGFRDLRNAIEHQHRRQRQLGIAGAEQFASRASQKLVIAETRVPVLHSPRVQIA